MKICSTDKCTGCRACEILCPTKSIVFQQNEEGFLFPVINENTCCNCGLCSENCPSNNPVENINSKIPKVTAVQHKDKDILFKSSSGGAFTALAEPFLKNNGVVFGSMMDTHLNVKHVAITELSQLKILYGSKYVQSDTLNTYAEAIDLLKNGKHVLYVGCPCQIAGLYVACRGVTYTNLTTVDLVCHGVSPLAFLKKHAQEISEKYGSKVIHIDFRNKEKKANQYVSKITFEDGSVIFKKAFDDAYMSCYLHQAIYRECCYNCLYACLPRIADFTIGDYVGVDRKVVSEDKVKEGISLIMINNDKAINYFEQIQSSLEVNYRPIDEATSTNLNLIRPSIRPNYRDFILKSDQGTVSERMQKFCKLSLKSKLGVFLGPKKIKIIKKFLYNKNNE